MTRVVPALCVLALLVSAGAAVTAGARSVQSDVWSGPLTITRGGTYRGSWESTSSSIPAVRVATTEPVTITGRVRNRAGGTLIDAVGPGAVQVTVAGVLAYGGDSHRTSGRFFQAYDFRSVTIRNSTIENTRGIELTYGLPGSRVLITRNRHRNIKGHVDNARGVLVAGNFVQFREVQNSAIEVSWNEIVNEYGRSHPEDIISLYHTSGAVIRDNMLWHQSTPGNAYATSSQGGITIDCSTPGPGCHRNRIVANQVVDGMGIVVYVTHGGDGNLLVRNRIVNDGRLPNGMQNGNGWHGMRILPGGANNHAHGNVLGYVNRDRRRSDGSWVGTPEGHAGEARRNHRLRGRITGGAEASEWTRWQKKLAANGIRLGA